MYAQSGHQFSDVQGRDGWTYGTWPAGATSSAAFTEFAGTVSQVWAAVPVGPPWAQVSRWSQHPSGAVASGSDDAAVRRWTSDVAGPARGWASVRDDNVGCGQGVDVWLVVDDVAVDTVNLPNDGVDHELSADVTLALGTVVELVVFAGADDGCDSTHAILQVEAR